MKLKKVTALILMAAITVSALAGCGAKNESAEQATNVEESNVGNEESVSNGSEENENATLSGEVVFPLEETMEFTSFSMMNGDYTLDTNLAMQTAMKNANINITFDSVAPIDLVEKRNLILASGEYPDMLFKAQLGGNDLAKYGAQGILIPLEDLIRQYAPNLTAVLDERDAWQYLESEDGHIYALPEIGNPFPSITTFWINKKWMDKCGVEEPKSFDELYDVLKAFKEQDANGNGDPDDEIPLVCNDGACPPTKLLAYESYGYDFDTGTALIDGELTYMPLTDEYKEFIRFLTKLYQEGLMDKNSFTQEYEQQHAIGQVNDVIGAFFDSSPALTVGNERYMDYIALTPFQEGTFPISTGITAASLSITDACERPDVLIAWADQFYSEEGGILAIMGVEGETYEVNEDGTWDWITGNGYGDDVSTVRASATIQGAANHPSIWPDYYYQMNPEADPTGTYSTVETDKVTALGKPALPPMKYSEEETKTIATIKADISDYSTQYAAQVITGELDIDESWDEYVSTVEAMGISELLDVYRAAYDRAVSN